jgi:peptide/nickel transport system substrate-binding protein
MMRRRRLLATSLASSLAPALSAPGVRAQPASVLRFIPQVDLAVLDPTAWFKAGLHVEPG